MPLDFITTTALIAELIERVKESNTLSMDHVEFNQLLNAIQEEKNMREWLALRDIQSN